MAWNVASSHKIDFVAHVTDILNSKRRHTCIIGLKVMVILLKKLIFPFVWVASEKVCGQPVKQACLYGKHNFVSKPLLTKLIFLGNCSSPLICFNIVGNPAQSKVIIISSNYLGLAIVFNILLNCFAYLTHILKILAVHVHRFSLSWGKTQDFHFLLPPGGT